jgi:hypothetical protein
LGGSLRALDDPKTCELWNFDIRTVHFGNIKGAQFVAIGSNADKRKRAANLALALLAAREMEPAACEAGNYRFSELVQALRAWTSSQPDLDGSPAQSLSFRSASPKLCEGSNPRLSPLQPSLLSVPSASGSPSSSQFSKESGDFQHGNDPVADGTQALGGICVTGYVRHWGELA